MNEFPGEADLRPVAALGYHAVLLLGMLGEPMLTRELHSLVEKSASSPVFQAIVASNRSASEATEGLERLHQGGVAEVRRTLERMERLGVVRKQLGSPANEGHLWWRVPVAEWPNKT